MRYVIDIEADGLVNDVSRIWCIVMKDIDTDELHIYRPGELEAAANRLVEAKELIGHNIIMYDIQVLERLLQISITAETVDTLLWSRLLKPDREGGHSLDSWGERLHFPKTKFTDFSEFSEEMVDYCINDVKLGHRIYLRLKRFFPKHLEAGKLEHEFAKVISKQISSGFRLDSQLVEKLDRELSEEYEDIYNKLCEILPRQIKKQGYKTIKESGRLISQNESGYSYVTPKTGIVKFKQWEYEEPNPQSRQQLIQFFQGTYNWKPTKFTDKGNPQLDESILTDLDLPWAQEVARLFRLNKLRSMIFGPGGWVKYLGDDGRVHGDVITIGAVTGRCTHSKPNMAQIDAKDKRMRACWIPRDDWKLVSCDADQLEARALAHYTYVYNEGELVRLLLEDDLHEVNRRKCNFAERKSAKTLFYGMMYGAGDYKLGKIGVTDSGVPKPITNLKYYGRGLRERLESSIVGLKPLNKDIQYALSTREYLHGLDGRPLYIRHNHAALNTLLQSAGAIIMKKALILWFKCVTTKYEYGKDFNLVANVHDEIVFECRPEIADELGSEFNNSIKKAGDAFGFKCPLEAGYEIGNNWGEIH